MINQTIRLRKYPPGIPPRISLIEGDNNAYSVEFIYIKDQTAEIDLGGLNWYVNIRNANGVTTVESLTKASNTATEVHLLWNVKSTATAKAGVAEYTIEARKANDDSPPVWRSALMLIDVWSYIPRGDAE